MSKKIFEIGKSYIESTSGNDYKVECIKLTKCFATFKSYSGEKTYKINTKVHQYNDVCYTGYGCIEA